MHKKRALLIGILAVIALGALLICSGTGWAGQPHLCPNDASDSCDGGIIIGDNPIVQVPEPSSLVLLTAGLGGLAWWLRRRR